MNLICSGELQSVLCAVFSSADTTYTGTLSGDVYKWKGHTLLSVIKNAHSVSYLTPIGKHCMPGILTTNRPFLHVQTGVYD